MPGVREGHDPQHQQGGEEFSLSFLSRLEQYACPSLEASKKT